MAEEASASVSETLGQNNAVETQPSNEATIKVATEGGTESTCNNNNNNDKAEASAVTSDGDREKTLEFADELMDKGVKAMKESDFGEATECFSRCLEIRVAHYGELAPQCVKAYYKYGCALLEKAQEEADPLGSVPKKEAESQQESADVGSAKNVVNGESSTASNAEQVASFSHQEGAADGGVSSGKDQEEDNEDSDIEDLAEGDEDETDLDLAWKMLDVARAIIEKQHSGDTMEKVEVLSALAEVALEREDFETSLSDYQNALSTLERLVEPDSRHIAELNFRICLCLEIGSKPEEAIPYCQKAISVCKSRVRRLMIESKSFSGSTASSSASEDLGVQQSSDASKSDNAVTDKQTEIDTLTELCGDLEKKLEDLQQLVSNPRSILGELLEMVSAKAKAGEKSATSAAVGSSQMGNANNNGGGFDSPTVSTAHTNGSSGVTHLGVVGRGVKRTLTNSGTAESSPGKKPALDSSKGKDEGNES